MSDENGTRPYPQHDLAHELDELSVAYARLLSDRDRLYAALSGLVGAESAGELRMMEAAMRMMPAPDADKAATLDAIHALLEVRAG